MNYEDLGIKFWRFCELFKGIDININELTYMEKEKVDNFIENIYRQRKIHKRNSFFLWTIITIGMILFCFGLLTPVIFAFLRNMKIFWTTPFCIIIGLILIIKGIKLIDKLPIWMEDYSKEEIKEAQNAVKNNIELFNNFLNIYHNLKRKDLHKAYKIFVAKNSNWVSYRYKNKKKKTKTYKFINK